jgi:ATP-binding cassette, subfamily B, bacterial
MPRHYTMGGRAATGGTGGLNRGEPPPRLALRERFGALRNVPPFLRMVWETNRALTIATLLLRLLRALLPVALLYVGKLIIDEVLRLAQLPGAPATIEMWLDSGLLTRLGGLLLLELGLAIASDVLGRVVSLIDALLSEQLTNVTSIRLMEHAATLDLEDFEDSELQDRLERARRQTMGRTTLMTQLFGQAQDIITIATFAAGLVWYAPWLIVLLLLALVPAFVGEAHFNAQSYSLNYTRTPERREIDYIRQTGASVETAKEVKIFGLNASSSSDIATWRRASITPTGARGATRGMGQCPDRRGHARILRGIRVSHGGHAERRVHDRRPHLPRGIVPATAQPARGPAHRVLADGGAGAVPGRPLLVLRDRAGDPLGGSGARRSRTDPRGLRVRERRIPLPGRRALGRAPPQLHVAGGRGARARRRERCGQDDAGQAAPALYDPDEGRILLDGHDLREYDLAELRANMGVIFQDFVRYHMTAGENIAVGRIEALTDAPRIADAARRSLADDVIARLPEGYDQVIGKRFRTGVELSGGEWQKIAIARAYMRDAQLLILDEPTAALDARAEFEVFQRFKELSHGRTAVLISHRFSSVRMADRILVMHDGGVEAMGTHEELLAAGGRYAELYR